MRSFFSSTLIALSLGFSSSVFAMGQQADVFELASSAGIWDHGDTFYLRIDLAELGGQKNLSFVWAGFDKQGEDEFKGELVSDQFGPNETRFPAKAKLLHGSASGRYFLIEVMDAKGQTIKELIIKGPALH